MKNVRIYSAKQDKVVVVDKIEKSNAEWEKLLTKTQYEITTKKGTETPGTCLFNQVHEPGLFRCVRCETDLFRSSTKFDSGTGWPSFTKPLEPGNIAEKEDRSFFMKRIEVRSKHGGSHLGHVFNDGPPPTGLRYCMNSAALRFIPKEDLEKDGYGEYSKLFAKK